MKKTVKLFRWSESRNKSEVVNAIFDDGSKSTFSSIELKRRKNEEKKNALVNWSM
jgi:hypothetical protein